MRRLARQTAVLSRLASYDSVASIPYGHEKSVGVVRAADEFLDRLDGDPSGDLAGRVSAHAVGDDEQPQILGADEAVLVDPANGAGLAQAECDHVSSLGRSLPRERLDLLL